MSSNTLSLSVLLVMTNCAVVRLNSGQNPVRNDGSSHEEEQNVADFEKIVPYV